MVIVTKERTFDSAHMLSNYNGKCNNLHGHTYKVQVSVVGELKESDNQQGMVLDFNKLNQIIKDMTDCFDHAVIFSSPSLMDHAESVLLNWCRDFKKKYIILDGKCTCENMAIYIKKQIASWLGKDEKDVGVTLWETPTSFAGV